MARARNDLADRASDAAARALIWLALRLPYDARVRLMGRLGLHLLAPLLGWRRRIRANLAYAWPELSADEVRRLAREVPDHVGRVLIETWSGEEFVSRAAALPIDGPGAAALEEARLAGRPVIAACAHFGSFNAVRAALRARGHNMSGLYRPMANPHFNPRYVAAMTEMGGGGFPSQGRAGLVGMMRHLARGGLFVLLHDIHVRGAPTVSFFGRPAPTATTAAELALRYGALLLPIYGVRRPDGLGFDLIASAPIEPGEPLAMTQALTDDLERMVRAHPEQWFWIHRRWEPGPGRKSAAT